MATKKTLWPVTTVTIILGMLMLPVFPQDEPPQTTEDAEASDKFADSIRRLEQMAREAEQKMAEIVKEAEEGDATSQVALGIQSYRDSNYTEALRWFRAAAEQGDSVGQYMLGEMYYNANGVSQDYKEALRWFRAAAEQGQMLAQHKLGVMYYNGQGVPQDYKEALRWYREPAERGPEQPLVASTGHKHLVGFCSG